MSPGNKIQEITSGNVRSLGLGRCLECGAMNSKGARGRGGGFWDNRVLQMVEMEVGKYSVSCRFKNCEEWFLLDFHKIVWTNCEVVKRRFFE